MVETPYSRLQKLMDQAATALWEEDWQEAIRLYRQAMELSPANASALASLGYALMRSGDLREASEVFHRSAELAPQDPLPWERLGSIAAEMEEIQQAVEDWAHAADLALEADQIERAVRDLQEVVKLRPDDHSGHRRLAALYEDMKRPNLAVQELLTCAALSQAAGDAVEAARSIEDALRLDPQSAEVLRALESLRRGRALTYAGAAAQVGLTRTPTRTEPSTPTQPETQKEAQTIVEEASAKAISALARWAFEQAEGSARGGQQEGRIPTRATSMKVLQAVNQGLLAERRGDARGARRLFGEALKAIPPQELPALAFSLGVLSWQDEPAKAKQLLEQAAEDAGYKPAALVLLGQMSEERREWWQAASAYCGALLELEHQLVPREAWPPIDERYGRLRSRFEGTQSDAVIERVARGAGQVLRSADGRRSLERLHSERESAGLTGEISLLELLVEPGFQDALHMMSAAREQQEQGKVGAALEEILLALGKAPHLLPLHVELAELAVAHDLPRYAADTLWLTTRAYLLRGEPKSARRALERLVTIDPLNTVARQALIGLYLQQGEPELALEQAMQLIRVEGQLADYDAAERMAHQALEMAGRLENPQEWNVRILEQLKNLQVQRLNWAGALASMEKLVELDPENVSYKQERLRYQLLAGRDAQAGEALQMDLAEAAQAGKLAEWRRFLRDLSAEMGENPVIRSALERLQTLDGHAKETGGGPHGSLSREALHEEQDHARRAVARGTVKKDEF